VKRVPLIAGLLLLSLLAWGGERHRVVIDTDGAADDLRAICLLLASPAIETRAIITSPGTLSPEETARKVAALLRGLGREDIPVGTGRALDIPPPPWRRHSRLIPWGEERETPIRPAIELLEEAGESVTFVALGALTNLGDLLERRPGARIRRVIWYNGHDDLAASANHAADPRAATRVLASGIPVEIVSGDRHTFLVDSSFVEALSAADTPHARLVVTAHRAPATFSLVASGHMKAWDDLVAVRLLAPGLFTSRPLTPSVTLLAPAGEAAARRARDLVLRVLGGVDQAPGRRNSTTRENTPQHSIPLA
jgi:pyrimidine-specific ribonucleoside hydrolase